MAVDSLITLALEGNHLCRLIAKHGGVRTLLEICVDPGLRGVRVNAFRALGTVCCVLEGIAELQVNWLADSNFNSKSVYLITDLYCSSELSLSLQISSHICVSMKKTPDQVHADI